jgi:flagellar protein FliO/FliZ
MVITTASLLTAAATLVAVLALIWLAGRAARFGGFARRPASGSHLSVQDVIALDARRRLYLIQCQDKHVLLLTGGSQDVVVGWPSEHPPDVERGQ